VLVKNDEAVAQVLEKNVICNNITIINHNKYTVLVTNVMYNV